MSIGSKEGRRKAKRYYWRLVGLMCLAVLVDGCAAVGERRALPGTGHGTPEGQLPPSPRYELLRLQTRDGTVIAAEFCKALDAKGQPLPDQERCPTMIFFYARAMCLAQASTQKLADYFRRMGVNVLIPEFPGYGMSEGSPTEKGCYAAADAAYDWVGPDHRRGFYSHSRHEPQAASLAPALAGGAHDCTLPV